MRRLVRMTGVYAATSALALGGGLLVGTADAAPPAPPLSSLPSGQSEIHALGGTLDAVASSNRRTPDQLKQLLLKDRTARIGVGHKLLYVDTDLLPRSGAPAPAGPYPYDQTFKLHSNPGAAHVIYLDFNGQDYTGTGDAWGFNRFVVGYDDDGNPAAFSNTELDHIQSAWERVAEDYSPTTVDVTTEDPGQAALDNSGAGDNNYGQRLLVTNDADAYKSTCGGTCGGISYVGVYGSPSYNTSLVFGQVMYGSPKNIAEAASHEVGHSLGLDHDGTTSGTEYYAGQGLWAPIMGVGYYQPLTQFSRGEYPGANNLQDDFAVMASYGASLRPTGTSTTFTSSPGSASGYIAGAGTASYYAVTTTCADQITAHLGVASTSPDLDASLTLTDSSGAVVSSVDPPAVATSTDIATGLGADLATGTLPAGTYTLQVRGVGQGDPASTGYSSYGSRGTYGVTVAFCSGGGGNALTVSKSGSGNGVVTSSPSGIDCGATCSSVFANGTAVTLTATPASGSTFAGWSGACSGTAFTCSVSMTAARTVGAAFNAAGTGTRVEETAVSLDGWTPSKDPTGTFRVSKVTGSTAQFSFSGTSVKWLTKKAPGYGKASVTIDGVNKGTFDLYASALQSYALPFTGLSTAAHRMVVKILGTKNAASTDYKVAVDGFTVGTATTQEEASTVLYNKWKAVAAAPASGGAYRVSSAAGTTASYTFTGTAVDWITYTGPGWGQAEVYIDGADRGTVDLYATSQHPQTAKTYSGLANGSHTIQVKVLGKHNAATTATSVPVDGFVVR
jgi:hypothetical protein